MKRLKRFWFPFLTFALCLAVTVLYYYNVSEQSKKQAYIIYIPKIIDAENDFWTTLSQGAQMAAKEYNVRLVIDAPSSETDYQTQNKLIYEAIEKKPDVLAISPIDTTKNQQAIDDAKAAGIHVIYIDSTTASIGSDTVIATNNISAGKKMGSYIKSMMDDNSKIAIVSYVKDSSTAIDREKGLRAALGSRTSQIVDTVYCNSDFKKSYQLTTTMLTEHPDITLIAGLNEYSAVGAGNAIRDLGLSEKVKVVGFDNSIASVEFLESGVFEGLVIQNSFNMGYLGIEAGYKITHGEAVDKFINSGCELITRDSMYTNEGQKLLFSFLSDS